MKDYRKLAPVIMILLFALGIYMVADDNLSAETGYDSDIAMARDYAQQGVIVYAMQYYESALSRRPSVELYMEIAQFYLNAGMDSEAYEWADMAVTAYPKDPKALEGFIEIACKLKDYVACYRKYNMAKTKNLTTVRMEEIMKGIEYEYHLSSSYEEVGAYMGSMCPVSNSVYWGYAGPDGKEWISMMYKFTGVFYDGKGPVVDLEGKAFYVNENGDVVYNVADVEYAEKLGLMEGTIYSVYDGKEWKFYDTEAGFLCGGYTDATGIDNGMFTAEKDGKWKVYNYDGTPKIDKAYDEILYDDKMVAYRNERFFVKENEQYKMIDINGQQCGTETYEDAKIFFDATYAAVKKNGKWGFIDKDGNWMINPEYDDARSFSNGLAAVCKDDMWGYIDLENKLCIDYLFDGAKDFNAFGVTFVYWGEEWNSLILYQKNY